MNVIRLYSDAAGESHFEQVDLKLTLREFAPPAAPLRASDLQPAQNYVILEVGAEWGGAVPHPSPARMMAFSLSGCTHRVNRTHSAACPQVAGVVALIREKKPALSSEQIKRVLIKTAIDVKKGRSAMGDVAGPGWDPATGWGFVNAKCAWLTAAAEVATEFCGSKPEPPLLA